MGSNSKLGARGRHVASKTALFHRIAYYLVQTQPFSNLTSGACLFTLDSQELCGLLPLKLARWCWYRSFSLLPPVVIDGIWRWYLDPWPHGRYEGGEVRCAMIIESGELDGYFHHSWPLGSFLSISYRNTRRSSSGPPWRILTFQWCYLYILSWNSLK